MNEEFLNGFSKDPETRKQAEHIWKMLDQMAEDNPDGYKKFVSQNIEEGTKEMKKKQEDSIQSQMVTAEPKLAFKMFANLNSMVQEQSTSASDKFNMNQTQIFDAKATISKLDKRVKFYLNLMVHPNVMFALNQKREELNSTSDIRQWHLVPLSFSQLTDKASTSFGYKVYFVDVVINDKVYEKIIGSMQQTDQYFLTLLRDTLQLRLMNDRNPVQVDFKLLQSLYYYELEKLSCNRLKSKQYKQNNGKGPVPLLLEYQINRVAQEQIKKKQEEVKTQDVKFKTEEKKETQNIEKNIESILGLEGKVLKKSPLIQEIPVPVQSVKPLVIIPTVPDIKIKTPIFNLEDSGDVLTIVIWLPLVTNFSEIDLQISKSEIKLYVAEAYELEQSLNYNVNNEDLKARWDKKNHKLTLKLNKL